MKHTIAKVAAAASIAAAAIFTPIAANAYAPDEPAGVTAGPGGTVTVPFTGFAPNETVSFTLTGEDASGATLAFIHFAVETADLGTKDANADGAVSPTITLPSTAEGTYTLTAVGSESGAEVAAVITVTAGPGEELPPTGADSAQLLGLWIGGGALLLAGGGIAVAATVRRHRNEAAA